MRTAHRRLLAEMSQRHATGARLSRASGLRLQEVQAFIEMLDAKGLIDSRELSFAERLTATVQLLGATAQRWTHRKARSLFD